MDNQVRDISGVAMDGVLLNQQHPTTFGVPSEREKAGICIGAFVKIGVRGHDGSGERFWVQVTELTATHLVGRIDNDLLYTDRHGLECDMLVKFEKRHILNIMLPK